MVSICDQGEEEEDEGDAETAPKASAPVVDKRPAIATTPSGSVVTDF